MFEIGWSELLVIGVVLIVVVGPKDLPKMLRTFGRTTSQLRRMAGDFRRQFDDALREAELEDVRDTVNDLRSLDPRHGMREALNPIRAVGEEIRSSLRTATAAPEPKVPSADAPPVPVAPPVATTSAPEGVPATAANDVATDPAKRDAAAHEREEPVLKASGDRI